MTKYLVASSKIPAIFECATLDEANALVDELNSQDESAYKDDNGQWQRLRGCEDVARIMSEDEAAEFEQAAQSEVA